MFYRALKTIAPAQLTVDNYKAYRPIDRDGKDYQKENAGEQASLSKCIRLSNDASANDRIRHIHEGRP